MYVFYILSRGVFVAAFILRSLYNRNSRFVIPGWTRPSGAVKYVPWRSLKTPYAAPGSVITAPVFLYLGGIIKKAGLNIEPGFLPLADGCAALQTGF